MGIENATLDLDDLDAVQAHYPSWGLKTWQVGPEPVGRSASLPLMGIENPRTEKRRSGGKCHSLPLMGIENDGRGPAAALDHGDSLPLMGIENAWSARHEGRGYQPHYPSWGLKTSPATARRSWPETSLPLMGIENHCAPVRRHFDLPLITPHGD